MKMKNAKNIFITGATGLIGGQILQRLQQDSRPLRLIALIRAENDELAGKRLGQRLAVSDDRLGPKISIARGDLCRPDLGLSPETHQDLRKNCDTVIHVAGETAFNNTEICQKVNIDGSKHLIDEIRTWDRSPRIFYISTASVCTAPTSSELTEDHPFDGYENGYVRSKRQAEILFRQSGLDIVILRPSIVLSRGLTNKSFARMILWIIPALQKLRTIPFRAGDRLDIVPVDFVAECIAEILDRKLGFDCYHLTAGEKNAVTCGQIARLVDPQVPFVAPDQWLDRKRKDHAHRRLMKAVDHYLPFIQADVVYSNRRLQTELLDRMPPCPPFTDYYRDLLPLIRSNRIDKTVTDD